MSRVTFQSAVLCANSHDFNIVVAPLTAQAATSIHGSLMGVLERYLLNAMRVAVLDAPSQLDVEAQKQHDVVGGGVVYDLTPLVFPCSVEAFSNSSSRPEVRLFVTNPLDDPSCACKWLHDFESGNLSIAYNDAALRPSSARGDAPMIFCQCPPEPTANGNNRGTAATAPAATIGILDTNALMILADDLNDDCTTFRDSFLTPIESMCREHKVPFSTVDDVPELAIDDAAGTNTEQDEEDAYGRMCNEEDAETNESDDFSDDSDFDKKCGQCDHFIKTLEKVLRASIHWHTARQQPRGVPNAVMTTTTVKNPIEKYEAIIDAAIEKRRPSPAFLPNDPAAAAATSTPMDRFDMDKGKLVSFIHSQSIDLTYFLESTDDEIRELLTTHVFDKKPHGMVEALVRMARQYRQIIY